MDKKWIDLKGHKNPRVANAHKFIEAGYELKFDKQDVEAGRTSPENPPQSPIRFVKKVDGDTIVVAYHDDEEVENGAWLAHLITKDDEVLWDWLATPKRALVRWDDTVTWKSHFDNEDINLASLHRFIEAGYEPVFNKFDVALGCVTPNQPPTLDFDVVKTMPSGDKVGVKYVFSPKGWCTFKIQNYESTTDRIVRYDRKIHKTIESAIKRFE